jgi:hypothetical protein
MTTQSLADRARSEVVAVLMPGDIARQTLAVIDRHIRRTKWEIERRNETLEAAVACLIEAGTPDGTRYHAEHAARALADLALHEKMLGELRDWQQRLAAEKGGRI